MATVCAGVLLIHVVALRLALWETSQDMETIYPWTARE